MFIPTLYICPKCGNKTLAIMTFSFRLNVIEKCLACDYVNNNSEFVLYSDRQNSST